MVERNLLLLTYHFPPSAACGSFRLLGLARHLPKFGFRPVVIAPPTLPWEPVDEELSQQVPAEAVVFPVPYPQGFSIRVACKLLSPDLVWLPSALKAARRAVRTHNPVAVLTSGPPHAIHWFGLALQRQGLPWIVDFRDPWVPHGPVDIWSPPSKLTIHSEKLILRRADRIISNAPLATQYLLEAYEDYHHKIVTITNGFDPERFEQVPAPNTGPLKVLHSGELYLGRDPRTFLDALCLLRQEPGAIPRPVQATFLGRNTDNQFDLDSEIRQRGLQDSVTQGGQVPYAQSLHEMTRSDLLLLVNGPGRRIGVPAKLYEYLGAGRPVLALADSPSDTAWVLQESGVPHRLVPPPYDPVAIKKALVELVQEIEAGRKTAPPEKLASFTREHMARRVAELVEQTLSNKSPVRLPSPGVRQESMQVK